ncbi:transposable element Tc1 transposase [Trichonephila clavipes]|nr:transposable element Tc1 transposase [Trichonephila clavipes]
MASLIDAIHGCVQKILQKYEKTGAVAHIPGRGRKEILSTTVKRKIIHTHDGRFKIWREAGKALPPKNTIKKVKFGGGSVLIWDCMSAGGVGELSFIDGIMDKHVYLGILKDNSEKSASKLGRNNFTSTVR